MPEPVTSVASNASQQLFRGTSFVFATDLVLARSAVVCCLDPATAVEHLDMMERMR